MTKQTITLNMVKGLEIFEGAEMLKVQGRFEEAPVLVPVSGVELVGFRTGFMEFADMESTPDLSDGEWTTLKVAATGVLEIEGKTLRSFLPSGTRVKKIAVDGNPFYNTAIAIRHETFEQKVLEKLGSEALALITG